VSAAAELSSFGVAAAAPDAHAPVSIAEAGAACDQSVCPPKYALWQFLRMPAQVLLLLH
jgi:hypothetical protein